MSYFTRRMTIAVRVMNSLRTANAMGSGWHCEHCLKRIHGIQPKTLAALARAGVIARRVDKDAPSDCGPRACRLRGRTIAIIEAVRA